MPRINQNPKHYSSFFGDVLLTTYDTDCKSFHHVSFSLDMYCSTFIMNKAIKSIFAFPSNLNGKSATFI
jgi:hypothetical protein